MAVQGLLQAQLIQVVPNEAHGSPQDEESVQASKVHQVVALFPGKGTAGPDHVNEAHGDAAVHVEDQVGALPRRQLLHLQRKVQHGRVLEVLLGVFLDDDDSLVRVREGLDAVADAHDELVGLLHLVDEVLGAHSTVQGMCEHSGGVVQGTSKPGANGEESAAERRDEVLAGSGCDDGVVRAAHGWSMVRSDHQDHLDELAASWRQLPAEPQQRQGATDAHVVLEDLADGDATILQFVATVV
mmetsp:Transcript_70290/g.147151  ORF Transcript_70290/g.147151 Transcript_70290/m.147151 type:complete len:242 (+) Transcript_70290:138-863(+)